MIAGAAVRLKDDFVPAHKRHALFAQVEEILSPARVKLNFMVRNAPREFHLGSDDADLVEVDAVHVAQHANIANLDSLRAHRAAWKQVGLRLVRVSDTSPDVFVPDDGGVANALDLVGDVDSDDEEQPADGRADLCGYHSDGGFVVRDDEGTEPFSLANVDDSEFVNDTHAAVRAFEEWTPTTEKEKRFHAWMRDFEQSIQGRDDNRQFASGSTVNYTRPPVKKKQRKQ